MKIGFVGLGKLGLPCAVAITWAGHKVYGYDINREKVELYRRGIPDTGSEEENLAEWLKEALTDGLYLCDSMEEMLSNKPDIVFIGVFTPSLPDGRFDTSYVEDVMRRLQANPPPTIAVSSTILPMTTRQRLANLTDSTLCYNPSFIAMGTVIRDFENPEFVLIGTEDGRVNEALESFYRTIVPRETPILHMTWENAELVKVRYNTYIGFKILIANECMEVCHRIPHADCDVVSSALKKATRRITSGSYFRGGMGDGGECHPRDQRALAWLGRQLALSTNVNDYVTLTRESQTEWLGALLQEYELPIVIMGKRFKANSNLTTDSASILLHDILKASGVKSWFYDPEIGLTDIPEGACTFLAAIDEGWVNCYPYPSGSVVLDVWRRFTQEDVETLKMNGVKYVPVGRGI